MIPSALIIRIDKAENGFSVASWAEERPGTEKNQRLHIEADEARVGVLVVALIGEHLPFKPMEEA